MKDEDPKASIIRRLARIEGQLRGLSRMVSDERPCNEVIAQIQAVKAGVSKVGLLIIEQKLDSCLKDNSNALAPQLESLRNLIIKLSGG